MEIAFEIKFSNWSLRCCFQPETSYVKYRCNYYISLLSVCVLLHLSGRLRIPCQANRHCYHLSPWTICFSCHSLAFRNKYMYLHFLFYSILGFDTCFLCTLRHILITYSFYTCRSVFRSVLCLTLPFVFDAKSSMSSSSQF